MSSGVPNESAGRGQQPPDRAGQDMELAFAAYRGGDWERARDLFQREVARVGSTSGEALVGLALCWFKLGSLTEVAQTLERASDSIRGLPQRPRDTPSRAELVSVLSVLGAKAAARGWEQRGLRLLEDQDPCIERAYLAVARTGCAVDDPLELEERAELALRLARKFGVHDLELRARAEKGRALVSRGYVDAGFALLDEVMVAVGAGEIGDETMRAKTICAMLSACQRTGDAGRAEYWCRRIDQEPELQHVLLVAHCSVAYGAVEALRGRWDEAEARLLAALRAQPAAYHRADAAAQLAELRIQQGRYAEGAELLAGYADYFEAMPTLAHLRLIEGQVEEAAGLLRSVVRGLGDDCIRLAPVLARLVEVELRRGDVAAAERAARRLGSLETRCESNEVRAYARVGAGLVARAAGDPSAALEDLETALTLLLHYDRPLLSAEIRLELARALEAAGDRVSAAVEAEAALATFRRSGIVPGATAAAELLQTLRMSAQPGARASGGHEQAGRLAGATTALTAREGEVASLVAQGLTNKEIAERLVLSVRTVEGHIERILGKLDFHTGTQLALWVGAR